MRRARRMKGLLCLMILDTHLPGLDLYQTVGSLINLVPLSCSS